MFEETETPVTEEVTENVEETTEETEVDAEVPEAETEEAVETFTKEQVDEMIAKKLARKEAKIRREYEKKYSRAETVLKAGLEKDNFEDAVVELENFYTEQGVKIPETPKSQWETEILAHAQADRIIDAGYEDIVEEVDRLANIGYANMTDEDKILFNDLSGKRKELEESKDLASIGLTKEKLPSDFNDFCSNLNPKLSIKEKYELYNKFNVKQVNKMGSMKSNKTNGVKDYYTPDEISRLTPEELDNPVIWEAVRNSMTNR